MREHFWLTNMTNRIISLPDLCVSIKPYSSVNLLDKKHYKYSVEELEKSLESGSIYKKRDKIALRKIPPQTEKKQILITENPSFPLKERSIVPSNEVQYEELNVSDEDFANENSELI